MSSNPWRSLFDSAYAASVLTLIYLLLLVTNLHAQSEAKPSITLLRKADSLRSVSRLKESEIIYQQVLLFDRNSVAAFKGLGKLALAKEDWPDFRKWFNRALEIDPQDVEAKDFLVKKSRVHRAVLLGDSLRMAGDLADARRSYESALDLDSGYPDAFKGLGIVAYEKRDWKDAHKWFNKVLEINPDDLEVRDFIVNSPRYREVVQEADNRFDISDFKAAREAYKEVLEMNRHAIHAMKRLGQMAFHEADWGEVKKWYKKALREHQGDLDAAYGLGIAYRETGKFKALLLKRKDFNRAEKHLGEVIRRDSTYRDVLYQRGVLSRLDGKWLHAVKWGHRQVHLKPGLAHTNVGLFKFYRLLLRHESDPAIDRWLDSWPGDWATFVAGERFRSMGRFVEADSVFNSLLSRNVGLSKTVVHLSYARCLVQQKKLELANQQFNLALSAVATDVDAEYLFDFSKYVLSDHELSIYDQLRRPEQKRAFFTAIWTVRNPTPASPVNERVLEHIRRLNTAEKNYWFDGLRSWANNPDKAGYLTYPKVYRLNQEFNDKGLVYIRHGKPDNVAMTSSRDISNESWRYKPREDRAKLIFHFVLEKQMATGNNWRLTPIIADRAVLRDRVGWDSKLDRLYLALSTGINDPKQEEINSLVAQLSDESRQVVEFAMSTDYHTYEKKVVPLEMPYFVSTMRGYANKTLLEVYFAIPLSQVRSDGPGEFDFEHGAGIYSPNWQRISREFEKVRLTAADSSRVFKDFFLQKYDFYLLPGQYNLAFYARNQDETRIGRQKIRATVPSFKNKSLALSDPVPAYDITPVTGGTPFDKGEVSITPNPAVEYKLSDPVFLYYEVYNLRRNEDRETRFRIENTLTLVKKSKGGLGRVFGFLAGGRKKSISIQDERTGTRSTSIEVTSFDVSKLEPGDYELTIRVQDLVSHQNAEKSLHVHLTK